MKHIALRCTLRPKTQTHTHTQHNDSSAVASLCKLLRMLQSTSKLITLTQHPKVLLHATPLSMSKAIDLQTTTSMVQAVIRIRSIVTERSYTHGLAKGVSCLWLHIVYS